MSYEGYEIWLCEEGHKHIFDCQETPTGEWKCPTCGATLGRRACVDCTNCAGACRYILVKLTEELTEDCSECGHTSVKVPATYHLLPCKPYAGGLLECGPPYDSEEFVLSQLPT